MFGSGSNARTGNYGAGAAGNTGVHCVRNNLANNATRVIGVACYWSAFQASMSQLAMYDGVITGNGTGQNASCQVGIGMDSTGHLVAYRGRAHGAGSGGTLLGTSTLIVPLNTWVYVEFKLTVDAAAGVVQVKVDGTDYLNLTSQNTRTTANSYSNAIGINCAASGTSRWDDFYCLNTDGAAPDNDFLGDVAVLPVLPSIGNGTHADSTPSVGTDRGALVDEQSPSTGDYNALTAAAQKDTYNYPAAGTTGTIVGVNVSSLVAKSTAGACTGRNIARIGGVLYNGVTQNMSTTYGWNTDSHRVSPATGVAWTEAEINGAEFGVERVV
jgi:hypothetical protein